MIDLLVAEATMHRLSSVFASTSLASSQLGRVVEVTPSRGECSLLLLIQLQGMMLLK
jgi:hypothetical protein